MTVEKRRYRDQPFDLRPISSSRVEDLDQQLFENVYLPSSVASDVLLENERDYRQKLSSLRLISSDEVVPTTVGLLAIGRDPLRFLPGAYVQFLRIDGVQLADPVRDQRMISGPIPQLIGEMDEVLKAHNLVSSDFVSGAKEIQSPQYPIVALQQIVRNAVMHRNYEATNAPIRITWFNDRVEVNSPGGPYGNVTVANFGQPGITDYRNPHLAEAMRNLGFVQRFGAGIAIARREMQKNENPQIRFEVNDRFVLAIMEARRA